MNQLKELEERIKNQEKELRKLRAEKTLEEALERVRTRTMAMKSSMELSETAVEMFRQIEALGVQPWSCGFNIINEKDKTITQWVSTGDGRMVPMFESPMDEDIFVEFTAAAQNKEVFYEREMGDQELKDHYAYLTTNPTVGQIVSEMKKSGIELPGYQVFNLAFFQFGYLMFITFKRVPEFHSIFERFAKVFEQTYTRFLDLQRAEAQARESEIQLALERVRAHTMAMQNSDELREVVSVVYKELGNVGIDIHLALILIYDWKSKKMEWWSSGQGIEILPKKFTIQISPEFEKHPWAVRYFEAQKNEKDFEYYTLEGEIKKTADQYLFEETDLKNTPEEFKKIMRSYERIVLAEAFMKRGVLSISILNELEPIESDLIKRFAKTIDDTFNRVEELRLAESQAREAEIQLALERIRARTMAMKSSSELAEVSYLLNKQVVELGIPTRGCAFNIYNETNSTEWFSNLEGTIPAYTTPRENIFLTYYEAGQRGEKLFIKEFEGEQIKKHYEYLSTLTLSDFQGKTIENDVKKIPKRQIDHVAYFKYGYLLFITLAPTPEAHDIFIRLAKEFEQTYTRFLDLQKAEAQVREAQIEASLEKIRGRAMAIRQSEELAEVIDLVFEEIDRLGYELYECNICIVDRENETIDIWGASGSEVPQKVTVPHFNHSFLNNLFEDIHRKVESRQVVLQGDELTSYLKKLFGETDYASASEEYRNGLLQIKMVYIQQVFMNHGYLEAIGAEPIPKDLTILLNRFTQVVDLAYTRFDDVSRAEAQAIRAQQDLIEIKAARQRAELALQELRNTQKQLIQSEKMASLGELTAGIAHEIQNPLNFVNNFSEVTEELVKEIKDERLKTKDQRDEALENELLSDIEQNLQKINHHGHRASSIVKGMLEHSRTSSGRKELTDINALADEYLRLAYHGLRAKDKSFNSNFETDFDPNLPKIEVIPQDIGRVLLNLINNAFQAVQEEGERRIEQGDEEYKPTVSVKTELTADNRLLIAIGDNGPGIPEEIKDKIFQPFFTTKPTGKGTGLGLSLAYDIVKGHGGTLAVTNHHDGKESRTVFTIVFPSNPNT